MGQFFANLSNDFAEQNTLGHPANTQPLAT
jgi:hypothetical protein